MRRMVSGKAEEVMGKRQTVLITKRRRGQEESAKEKTLRCQEETAIESISGSPQSKFSNLIHNIIKLCNISDLNSLRRRSME